MKPIYIHSGMAGAPQYANTDGNINAILEACLISGFNTKTATSASASGGILTLNFADYPQFEALQTVEVAVASVPAVNGLHRVIANTNNQVTVAIPSLADGAVASSGAGITIKQAGAGWSKPFSNSTVAVFRPPAGNRRYLRFVHQINANSVARGYEEMTGLDTGTGLFPTVAQSITPVSIYNVSYNAVANAPWFVIATDKWVVFSLANAVVPNYSTGHMFFGDLSDQVQVADSYATLLMGITGNFLARNHAADAGAVSASIDYGSQQGGNWPSPMADGLRLVPYMRVHQGNGEMRGVLPNTYKSLPAAPSANFLAMYANITGMSGRAKPIAPQGPASALVCAITIDEEAWT